jgi:hypothetical protein
VDMDIYARLTGHLRRVLETLGMERRARDVRDLTLADIQDEYAQRNAAEAQSCVAARKATERDHGYANTHGAPRGGQR